MGVLATTVPSVQNLFAIVGTQISSMLQPIERSCTDNGIETTVVAAMNDNDMVDIYVAVKDLEGSRINERTNLADVQLSGHCHDADGADGPVRRKNCDSHLPH